MKFTGYGPKWNKCTECGRTLLLRKKTNTLVHRPGGKKKHDLVLEKRAEASARSTIRFNGTSDLDDQLDLLDGEAIITSTGSVCFTHNIFLNNQCIDCELSL